MNTRQFKQPREGITGTDRTGNDLLSLEESATAHRDALIALADHLGDATQVGNPAPIVSRMSERLRHPQPGDLVVEQSRGARARDVDTRTKAFGILIEHREEWWETDDEWAKQKAEDDSLTDEDRMTDDAWYIQYGPEPADVCRWVNCSFAVVPIDPGMFRQPIGTRDGSGVVITRDDLLGGLADSGFTLRTPEATP